MKLGKLRVTFKDPDALDDQTRRHVRDTLAVAGLEADEVDELVEARLEKVRRLVRPWVKCGEYMTVEFDLDAQPTTARVLTVDEANGRAKGGG